MGTLGRMYKPKQANVEKLNKYIEKLKKDGEFLDDNPDRDGSGDRTGG